VRAGLIFEIAGKEGRGALGRRAGKWERKKAYLYVSSLEKVISVVEMTAGKETKKTGGVVMVKGEAANNIKEKNHVTSRGRKRGLREGQKNWCSYNVGGTPVSAGKKKSVS